MTTEFLKDFTEKAKENFAPVTQLNALMSESMQALWKSQVAATQRYSEMTMEQVKAATQIRDMESLQHFFQTQIGTFEAINEQIMADVKAMTDAGIQFKADFEAILNPSNEPEAEPAAPDTPAKAAASKARK